MSNVVVFGSINADFVLRVDRLPRPGETVEAVRETHPGGKGANQAIAASACGASTKLVGAIGDDGEGAALLQNLRDRHVDVGNVQTIAGEPTGAAAIPVDSAGENCVIYAAGANLRVLPTLEAARRIVRDAGAASAMLEIPMPAIGVIAEACSIEAVPFILNAAPVQTLAAKVLSKISTLVVNEHEASALSGEKVTDVDEAIRAGKSLLEGGPLSVIVTLGQLGAVVIEKDRTHHIAAPSNIDVVDTTGAGDTFCGALAASLAAATDLLEATDRAVKVASLKVQFRGAQLPAGVPIPE